MKLTISAESDEKAAMDESNILDSRTRGAAKPSGTYTEPGDDEVSIAIMAAVSIVADTEIGSPRSRGRNFEHRISHFSMTC